VSKCNVVLMHFGRAVSEFLYQLIDTVIATLSLDFEKSFEFRLVFVRPDYREVEFVCSK